MVDQTDVVEFDFGDRDYYGEDHADDLHHERAIDDGVYNT